MQNTPQKKIQQMNFSWRKAGKVESQGCNIDNKENISLNVPENRIFKQQYQKETTPDKISEKNEINLVLEIIQKEISENILINDLFAILEEIRSEKEGAIDPIDESIFNKNIPSASYLISKLPIENDKISNLNCDDEISSVLNNENNNGNTCLINENPEYSILNSALKTDFDKFFTLNTTQGNNACISYDSKALYNKSKFKSFFNKLSKFNSQLEDKLNSIAINLNEENCENFTIQSNSNIYNPLFSNGKNKNNNNNYILKLENLFAFDSDNYLYLKFNASNFSLLQEITELCLEKKFFAELSNFYLETSQEMIAFNYFALYKITEFYDYEDAVFSLAEHLTKFQQNTLVIFELMKHSSENNYHAFYPIFSVCIRKLIKKFLIQEALILVNYMIEYKIEISTSAITLMIETLGKCNRMEEASEIFSKLQKYNPVNAFPKNYINSNYNTHSPNTVNGDDSNCDMKTNINNAADSNSKITYFSKLSLNSGINIITYGVFIKYLCKNNLMEVALLHYDYLKQNKLIKDEIIFNLLIDGCGKTSNSEKISSIFEDMQELGIKPSIVTFNSIIDAYVRAKNLKSAWKTYETSISLGITPDNFTYSTLFRGIRHPSQGEYLKKALSILNELTNQEQSIDIILINVLIDSCISMKDETNLILIFDNTINKVYKNLTPDIITFNTFIKGCAQLNLFEEAYKAYTNMIGMLNLIQPNDVTFNTMIDVCVRNKKINLVWEILEKMKELKIQPDNFTYSTIIKGINKKTNLNSVTQNMSKGYPYANKEENETELNQDRDEEADLDIAFKLFDNVKKSGTPDEILYNCIMDACLRFGKIQKMMEYHSDMIKVLYFFFKNNNYFRKTSSLAL